MTQASEGQGGATPAAGPAGTGGEQGRVPTFSWKPMEQPWTGETKADDKTMGMLCHLLALSGLVTGLGFILGPLIVWLIKKDQSRYVDVNGREAVNFVLSMLIYGIVLGVPSCGILAAVVVIFEIIMLIVASVKANKMIVYRYPLAIRFIK